MLHQVRKTLKGAVAWFFAVLLILAFALWGIPRHNLLLGSRAPVTVGKQSFSQQYVQNEFNRVMQMRRNQNNGAFTREDAIAQGLDKQVLANITTTSALSQFTDKMKLALPREYVRDYLQNNQNFQNPATGKFDETVLRNILQENNMSVGEFERRIAEDLTRDQLVQSLVTSAAAPNEMMDSLLLRDVERRQISYLIVTNEMAGVAAEPTPADLETYYQDNPSVFTAPEYRSFDMLLLRSEDFQDKVDAPEDELRKIYEIKKPREYDQPEKRTLYQITYETEKEAQEAVDALHQGKPFEDLAVARDVDLAAVTFTDVSKTDILDPAAADAEFASDAKEGAIIGPVKGVFGWTVAQIAGITPPATKTFEEVRDAIKADYVKQDARRALLNAIDQIEEERDTGAGLEAAAEATGYKIQTVGPVDRYSFAPGGAIVDKIPGEVLSDAFSLEEGEESEAVELASHDGYFFISVREVTPPALKPFDEVRDQVEQRWRDEERKKRISNTVRSIREAVEGGQTLEQAASQYDRTPTSLVLDRKFENEAISRAFNEQIFSATKGELVSGPAALGEAQIIADVRNVGFAMSTVPADQKKLFAQYVGQQLDQELVEAFVTAVRDDFDIQINQAQMDAVFGLNQ